MSKNFVNCVESYAIQKNPIRIALRAWWSSNGCDVAVVALLDSLCPVRWPGHAWRYINSGFVVTLANENILLRI